MRSYMSKNGILLKFTADIGNDIITINTDILLRKSNFISLI